MATNADVLRALMASIVNIMSTNAVPILASMENALMGSIAMSADAAPATQESIVRLRSMSA